MAGWLRRRLPWQAKIRTQRASATTSGVCAGGQDAGPGQSLGLRWSAEPRKPQLRRQLTRPFHLPARRQQTSLARLAWTPVDMARDAVADLRAITARNISFALQFTNCSVAVRDRAQAVLTRSPASENPMSTSPHLPTRADRGSSWRPIFVIAAAGVPSSLPATSRCVAAPAATSWPRARLSKA